MSDKIKAGEGEHQTFLVHGNDDDQVVLTPQKHYLAIDAVSWFVNLDSSWFRERLATGTLSVKIGSAESYHVALGLYELKGGARTAPVFDRPVLPERVFRGGPVTVQAVISGLSKTTGIGKLLQGIADAALGVVGTMVQSASLAGPSQVLSSAGSALVGGVRELLNTQDAKLRLFDPTTGIEKTLSPTELHGRTNYLLLYRGAQLDAGSVAVSQMGTFEQPLYQGQPLDDGVWLLLRLRRTLEYPAEPAWLKRLEIWIAAVQQLADNLGAGALSADQARNRLNMGGDAAPSLYDTYQQLTTAILSDAQLTVTESGSYAAVLRATRLLALRLVNGGNPEEFEAAMTQVRTGTLTDPELRAAVTQAAADAARARAATVPSLAPMGVLGDAQWSDAASPRLPLAELPRLRSLLVPTAS